jgi:hypothetical protein
MRFKEWFLKEDATLGTELVNDQISNEYNKAKFAIDLVREYDSTKPDQEGNDLKRRKLLPNINTIAKLSAGPRVFGLFNPAEDNQIISGNKFETDKMNAFFKGKIQSVPESMIKKYFPTADPNLIKQSSIIRVNVPQIKAKFGDSPKTVLEIAKTIVHEATHELERQITGSTKDGPGSAVENAEAEFETWATRGGGKSKFQQIIAQVFPGQKLL